MPDMPDKSDKPDKPDNIYKDSKLEDKTITNIKYLILYALVFSCALAFNDFINKKLSILGSFFIYAT